MDQVIKPSKYGISHYEFFMRILLKFRIKINNLENRDEFKIGNITTARLF
jgi:hypothetical protein